LGSWRGKSSVSIGSGKSGFPSASWRLALPPEACQESDKHIHFGRAHLLSVGWHVTASGRAITDLIDKLVARHLGAYMSQVGSALAAYTI
jgi:hypothetical protein